VNICEVPKILVVDDHVENLTAMRHVLKKTNSDVVCVESGNDALKEILRNEFSVVLMDVQMPEMNGFETAELIRSQEETQNLPIIFLTAINKEKKYVKQGYRLGAVDYLFKPFDPEVLRFKVSVFIELSIQKGCFVALARKNKLILDSVSDGVIGTDAYGEIIFSNPAACKMLSEDKRSLENSSANAFIFGEKNKNWQDTNIYKDCMGSNGIIKRNLRFLKQNNQLFPVECTVTAMRNEKDQVEGFVLVFEDITSRLESERQLVSMTEHDPLTGLPNRRLFYKLLPQALAKSKRLGHQVTLMFIDIDHFKVINDTYGHIAGDILLSEFSKRLTSCVRESDTVVRLSGDEFTIILEGELDVKGVNKLVKGILLKMASPYKVNNSKNVKCTVSIGIAMSSESLFDANELIHAADVAMYYAKENGRNNFQFFDNKLNQKVSLRSTIENELKNAIANNELYLHYQPKVDVVTEKIIGVESLVRWKSKILGQVPPAEFIPIAEDSGLIEEVGLWVLQEACKQYRKWKDKDIVNDGFCISVNISTRQLNNSNFLLSLDNILKESQVDPNNFDIEITESTLMSNLDVAIPLLRLLNQMGMSISIDDFGTGYSSLNYLKILPINFLKIDQSFIRDLFKDSNSNVITNSIINLSHNLGLQVIAEGVETKSQLDFLRENKCDIIQGYYFSKPISSDNFIALMRSQNNTTNLK
jgi:diguanylate cyclase (GGDEF)-like protein/PAS domain S-box-containing protein